MGEEKLRRKYQFFRYIPIENHGTIYGISDALYETRSIPADKIKKYNQTAPILLLSLFHRRDQGNFLVETITSIANNSILPMLCSAPNEITICCIQFEYH